MARRVSTFTQSDVKRAVKAARDAGVEVGMVEVAPDGTIRVISATANENCKPSGMTPFDKWREKRGARET